MKNKININVTGGKAKFENITQGKSFLLNQEDQKLFEKIRETILKEINNKHDQELILLRLAEFENSVNTKKCSLKYQEFIATTANYMTIMAPFIPSLTKLIV